jgi:AcrR family transcriptional regulator
VNIGERTESRSYTKVARAEGEERTRTAILDAAEAAFVAGASEHQSLDRVAASAGTTRQTLLRHFGSRAGLTEAAIARAFEHVAEQRMGAPREDIAGAVENLLDHYEERGRVSLRISRVEGDGMVAELNRRGRSFHRDWVEHAFGRWLDAVPAPERRRLRAALIALCDVQTWWLLSHDMELEHGELAATLTLTIRRLLGAEG